MWLILIYSHRFEGSIAEAAIDVITDAFVRHILPDNPVKLCDPGLNRSMEMRPKFCSVFFFCIASDRL